jgi:hypothetical protein
MILNEIRVITKLPNSEQSYKGGISKGVNGHFSGNFSGHFSGGKKLLPVKIQWTF